MPLGTLVWSETKSKRITLMGIRFAMNKMVAIRMAMVAKKETIIARVMGQVATILSPIGIPIAGWIQVTRDG
uniref:Uncharacterized protein n=1 Tax=Candidatus Methanogaster sp. ANME-2c ERB4 TaxID=2759911 RepID=A0A7G9Y110_9EURY|nr:hypothetical protein KBHNNLIF_00005 [Methanosarcinales archaeon ANME-2c ERB4]